MCQLNIIKIIKKDCKEKLVKDIKGFLKNKKKKGHNIVMNDGKTYKKNKNLVEYKKNIIK